MEPQAPQAKKARHRRSDGKPVLTHQQVFDYAVKRCQELEPQVAKLQAENAGLREDLRKILRLWLVPEVDQDKAQATGEPVFTGRWSIAEGSLFQPRHLLGTELYASATDAALVLLGQIAAFLMEQEQCIGHA